MGVSEKVYFSDKQITISNMRIAVNGMTYPLNIIGNVVMREERPYRLTGIGICTGSIIIASIMLIVSSGSSFSHDLLMSLYLGFGIIMLLGLILCFVPITYNLVIDLPSGGIRPIESKDPKYIVTLCNAINSARGNR